MLWVKGIQLKDNFGCIEYQGLVKKALWVF